MKKAIGRVCLFRPADGLKEPLFLGLRGAGYDNQKNNNANADRHSPEDLYEAACSEVGHQVRE